MYRLDFQFNSKSLQIRIRYHDKILHPVNFQNASRRRSGKNCDKTRRKVSHLVLTSSVPEIMSSLSVIRHYKCARSFISGYCINNRKWSFL